jgi:hypothetical protein
VVFEIANRQRLDFVFGICIRYFDRHYRRSILRRILSLARDRPPPSRPPMAAQNPTAEHSQPLRLKLRLGGGNPAAPSSEASSVISEDDIASRWDTPEPPQQSSQHRQHQNAGLDTLVAAALDGPALGGDMTTPTTVDSLPRKPAASRNRRKPGEAGPGKAWRKGMKGYQKHETGTRTSRRLFSRPNKQL